MRIDHIVLAAPDLERATTEFAAWTGTRPINGGPHPGGGTRNALVSFGEGAYLEIIAPDPAQTLAGTNGERFARLEKPALLHWAVRTSDLQAVADRAQRAGFVPGPIRDMARDTPGGVRLQWQLMGIGGHRLGGLVPFFIDWHGCPHPADSAPLVGALTTMSLPAVSGLDQLLAQVAGVELGAEDSGMIVEFESSAGARGWRQSAPSGFGF